MLSPYHRAKSETSFEIPEQRDSLLYAQRTLYSICERENAKDPRGAMAAVQKFGELVNDGFPENLRDLTVDMHSACSWALNKRPPPESVLQAAVLFAGTLLQHKEVSAAIPLLRRIGAKIQNDTELKAVWAINSAVATERLYNVPSDEHWELAIRHMPLTQWRFYQSLVVGCKKQLQDLRRAYEDQGDLQALLAAAPLAERAYAALTDHSIKGSLFESSGGAVRLLVEIARLQHATVQAGFPTLHIPPTVKLFEHAIINASVNKVEEDLFVRALTTLAQHYSSCGDRQNARDLALKGIAECATIKKLDPQLVQALTTIFEASKDSSD